MSASTRGAHAGSPPYLAAALPLQHAPTCKRRPKQSESFGGTVFDLSRSSPKSRYRGLHAVSGERDRRAGGRNQLNYRNGTLDSRGFGTCTIKPRPKSYAVKLPDPRRPLPKVTVGVMIL